MVGAALPGSLRENLLIKRGQNPCMDTDPDCSALGRPRSLLQRNVCDNSKSKTRARPVNALTFSLFAGPNVHGEGKFGMRRSGPSAPPAPALACNSYKSQSGEV